MFHSLLYNFCPKSLKRIEKVEFGLYVTMESAGDGLAENLLAMARNGAG